MSGREKSNPYDHKSDEAIFQSGDPFRNFNFTVGIEAAEDSDSELMEVAGFQEVSGLEVEVEPETYEEGGRHGQPHYLPGTVTYPDLTLKRGLTNSSKLFDWMSDVRMVLEGSTGRLNKMKRSVRVQLNSSQMYSEGGDAEVTATDRGELKASSGQLKEKGTWVWKFANAYPVSWSGPDMDATSGDGIAIQELTLKHDGFSKGTPPE